MSNHKWSADELNKISGADDLKISPFRDDGVTYGTPTWIWNVAVNGELYVRALSWAKLEMVQVGNETESWTHPCSRNDKGRLI